MLFGLIGKSLSHSFSEKYFSEKFKRESIQAEYRNFEINSIDEFQNLIQTYPFSGLNVTIPYKREIIRFLDSVSEEAKSIGAVNTIVFKEGKTIGHNTDHLGFSKSIDLSKVKKALILGNGGAHHAIYYALEKHNIDIDVLARNPLKNQILWEDKGPVLSPYDLVVNTTPLGTYPMVDECPPLQYDSIKPFAHFYDLVYNPAETRFLREAKAYGAFTQNGFEMLRGQAEAAFLLWTSF